MSNLEVEIRETFRAAEAGAPPVDVLSIRGMTDATSWPRSSMIGAAAAAAVLIAGSVLVSNVTGPLASDESPHAASGSPVAPRIVVATSSWKPGDYSQQALLTGTLRTTSDGCPYIDATSGEAGPPSPVALVWPAGYQAHRAANGQVEVTGPDGSVVVREGEKFKAGGGYTASGSRPCTLGTDVAFVIQSSITAEP